MCAVNLISFFFVFFFAGEQMALDLVYSKLILIFLPFMFSHAILEALQNTNKEQMPLDFVYSKLIFIFSSSSALSRDIRSTRAHKRQANGASFCVQSTCSFFSSSSFSCHIRITREHKRETSGVRS